MLRCDGMIKLLRESVIEKFHKLLQSKNEVSLFLRTGRYK